MFWGLVLEPGKRYSTTVEKSFHVSKAVMDCSSVRNDNEILSVMLETEGSESLLCNLCKNKGILQESLDLNFMMGDRLTFECRGHGRIHLSGYLLPEEEDEMSNILGDEEESEEEEEEEESEWTAGASPEKQKKEKRKHEAPPEASSKKKKLNTEIDEEEEGDSDSLPEGESDLSEGDDEDLEDEEDDDLDDEEESEDEVEETNQKLKQKQKTPNKQNLSLSKKSPVTNGIPPKDQKMKKSPEKSPGPGGDKTSTLPKQKQILDHGVMVKDSRVGNGPPAKLGKMVTVYYVGKLKDSGKVFDKTMKGNGFQFRLGKGEVIKAWDLGVQGMRIGGKRTIHCPPESAYGSKGVPPKIPPNSTLIFEVELKGVH